MTQPTDESNKTNQVNISGGAYVEGDVVHGDKVVGDQTTVGDVRDNIGVAIGTNAQSTVIIQRLDPTDARNQRNHKVMRQLVRSFWIDGVLKHSLYNEVLIRLNLEQRPDAVDNRPWDLILHQPGQPDYSLPASIPIIDVFDKMNQLLLILGEPGSGKTTMLLELADVLLKRAEADPTHPTPVVFNLSSWAEKRPSLAKWLIEELRTKYNIPKKIAQKWIEEDELLLLLDGLDEVRQEHRNACVVAINTFRQEHLMPVVVCCRVAEYGSTSALLRLQAAVLVQPLTAEQIDTYLAKVGSELIEVRIALQKSTELQQFARSPLMLNIILFAYQGLPTLDSGFADGAPLRHQHLFDAYIMRMFAHRSHVLSCTSQQMLHWLNYLSRNVIQQQQTVFLIENLQPNWLRTPTEILLYKVIVAQAVGLVSGLTFGMYFVLLGAFFGQLYSTPYNILRMSIEMIGIGLVFGLFYGLVVGLFDVSLDEVGSMRSSKQRSFMGGADTQRLVIGLLGALLGVLPGIMYYRWLYGELHNDLVIGIVVSLVVGLFVGLFDWLYIFAKEISIQRLLNGLITGLVFGFIYGLETNLVIGMVVSLVVGLFVGLFNWLFVFNKEMGIQRLLGGLTIGITLAIRYGGIYGLLFGIVSVPLSGLNNIHPTEQLIFNKRMGIQRLWGRLMTGLLGASLGVLLGMVFMWFQTGIIYGQDIGLSVALTVGSIVALLDWVLVGLIKNLEIAQRFQPNQGIWHSARNMISGGLLVGLIAWLAGFLFNNRFFLDKSTTLGRILSAEILLILGLILGLIQYGGLACIQHFVLRTFLWMYSRAPFNYARFLDYCVDLIFLRRVGGGYIFIHQMLLEHFASLTDEDIERIASAVEARKRA